MTDNAVIWSHTVAIAAMITQCISIASITTFANVAMSNLTITTTITIIAIIVDLLVTTM